jgi:hypothetical protein
MYRNYWRNRILGWQRFIRVLHAHFTLSNWRIWSRWIFTGNTWKKTFPNWISYFTPEEEQSLEPVKYIE